jgi:hypothetical protein
MCSKYSVVCIGYKVIFVLWCGEYGLDKLGTQKYLYLVIEFCFPYCKIKLKMKEMN